MSNIWLGTFIWSVGLRNNPAVFTDATRYRFAAAAEKWFSENDAEGVAFEYEVLE
jgi:hypothetical protein